MKTGKKYIKIINGDEKIEVDEYILKGINKIKKETKLERKLMTL